MWKLFLHHALQSAKRSHLLCSQYCEGACSQMLNSLPYSISERPYVPNLITCSTGGATIQHPLAMCLSSTQITRFGCFSASQIECRIRKIICKFSQESQAHSLTCFASLAEADQSGLPHSGGHHGDRPLRQSSSLLFLIEAIIKQFLSENCLPKIDSQAC